MSSTKSFAKKHRQAINLSAFVATALAVTTSSTIVKAGTIRHDVDDSEYRNLANQFPSVGFFGAQNFNWMWGCSGTLIDPSYVLTAAHCLEDTIEFEFLTNGTFMIGDNDYAVSAAAVLQHPEWNRNGSDGNDIALLRLLDPVSGVQPATLFSGNDENGKVGTYVGFGRTGNGLTGADINGGRNQKRAGRNIINIGSTNNGQDSLLFSDFSRPGTFELKNIGGRCLDVQWGNISNSETPVMLYECNNTHAQQWYREGDQIKNVGGKALDVQWGGIDNNETPIWIYDSNGTAAQQWSSPNFGSYGPIQNVGGKCLDVEWGVIDNNETPIHLWDCNGTDAQKWKANDLDIALDLEYQIAPGDSGGGLFIDGQLAGVNSFITEKNGGSLLPGWKVDSTYLDSSSSTRVSSFIDFINDGMRALANREIATGFRSDAQPFGFGSGGFSFAQAPLAPDFDYFDESFHVTVIDNSDFEYLLSLNDNPVLNPTAPERVPEPSTTLSLLVVGVGAASILKRKRKNNSGN